MYAQLRKWVADFWSGIRSVSGDDAYERYLKHHALEHAGAVPLSRRAYYDADQQRKWSGINRCC